MTTVICPDGSFVAKAQGGDVLAYKGVRYATADRFEPPIAYRSNGTPCEAVEHGSSPMQTPGMLELLLGLTEENNDEDCLFLNVYTPADKRTAPRPVLFWIYGGAFVNGSSSIAWYDGTNL